MGEELSVSALADSELLAVILCFLIVFRTLQSPQTLMQETNVSGSFMYLKCKTGPNTRGRLSFIYQCLVLASMCYCLPRCRHRRRPLNTPSLYQILTGLFFIHVSTVCVCTTFNQIV